MKESVKLVTVLLGLIVAVLGLLEKLASKPAANTAHREAAASRSSHPTRAEAIPVTRIVRPAGGTCR